MIIKMKKAKKIASYVLAFILSLFIIVTILMCFIYNSFLNEISVRKSMTDTNYYYNMYTIVKDTIANNIMQSGFDESILKNVITEVRVQDDINRITEGIYGSADIEISTEAMQKELNKNIKDHIRESGYSEEDVKHFNTEEFEKSIIDNYKNGILYSKGTLSNVSVYLKKIKKVVKIAIIVCFVIIAILMFVLHKLNPATIGTSMVIAGLFFIITRTYSMVNIAINNVLMFNWAFSRTATFMLNQLLKNIFIMGVLLMIAGIGTICLNEYMKYKTKCRR